MKNILKTLKNQKGLAMDEMILVIAMVTSLAAFVVVSVPWGNIGTTSSKIISQLKALEEANAAFYAEHKVWPHQTTDGDWKRNAAALASTEVMVYPYSTNFTAFLKEIKGVERLGHGRATWLKHAYGEGGAVLQRPVGYGNAEFLEIVLQDVPLSDARKIDREVDGEYNPEEGRVSFIFVDAEERKVNLRYRANRIGS